jgi:hypothetical protein
MQQTAHMDCSSGLSRKPISNVPKTIAEASPTFVVMLCTRTTTAQHLLAEAGQQGERRRQGNALHQTNACFTP